MSTSSSSSDGNEKQNRRSKNNRFPTWSFDDPCTNVSSWNSIEEKGIHIKFGNAANSDKEDIYESDLIFVGLCHFDADNDDIMSSLRSVVDYEDNNMKVDYLVPLMKEDYDVFQNGKDSGSMTSTLRVTTDLVGFNDTVFRRYVVLGLGPNKEVGNNIGNAIGKAIAKRCNEENPNIGVSSVLLPQHMSPYTVIKDAVISFYTSIYQDNRFRGTLKAINKIHDPAKSLHQLELYQYDSDNGQLLLHPRWPEDLFQEAIQEGQHIADGVYLAKDIVNTPHNVLNSLSLATLARQLAMESVGGCLTCTILTKKECEEQGMGAYLGVARASETPPQFIHLTYTPSDDGNNDDVISNNKIRNNKVVGVVGKGLLFDTGGYNIKTSGMELMKFDCGGAAAVLGAAKVISHIKPAGVVCHFVIAACDNMINSKGIVPSDILQASNGVTIEVVNTDAEGRLTLADALVYCNKKLKCEKIIELSTLTGSCMVALGKEVCGVFTENDDLAKEIDDISKVTNEQSWRMPLIASYNEQLKSSIADITNYGNTPFGGSITAGLFLQHFIDNDDQNQIPFPFAHIDIAGPCWDDKSKSATGFGTKLVTEWICRQGGTMT